ncbi:MAG: SO_0444 family Cu/Zn efflux transporter [Pseudomonadota bacterium]
MNTAHLIVILKHLLISAFYTFSEMAPYLLFGFFVAGVLSVLISAEKVEKHLGGSKLGAIIKASLFGVPLPLCSCGVIPVAASLRKHGASRSATTSFLISTPQTGVDSILVTYSLLGPVFAIVRPVVAFFSGIIGGILVLIFGEKGEEPEHKDKSCCTDDCCVTDTLWKKIKHVFHYGFGVLPRDIGRALIIGILVAAVISGLVPDDFFASVLGGGIATMLVMMLVGIPVYVCATASVPIAAVLIAKGVSPGAALVFLMTGPATNAATIGTIWKIMGKRTAIVYLFSVMATALLSGLALDSVFSYTLAIAHPSHSFMIPSEVKFLSAVVLTLILLKSLIKPRLKATDLELDDTALEKISIIVTDMHSDHCAHIIEKALGRESEVQRVVFDTAVGKVEIYGTRLNRDVLRSIIEGVGYTVGDIKKEK